MVKLAQHIDWPSQLPSKAGEGASSNGLREKKGEKKVDRQLANGKPRKTLAELFEARATPSSSFSTTTVPPPLSSSLSTTLPSSPRASSSSSSTTLPSSASASSSSSSSSACPSSSTLLPASTTRASSSASSSSSSSSSSAQVHVTFDDKLSAIHRKPAAHRSSEYAGSIKRSSSARKIADSSPHEGMHTHPSSKRISKSGPLAMSEPLSRSPLTNASNSEPSRWISPAKPSNGHSNENPVRSSSTFEQEQRAPLTNSSNSEQRYWSPFRIHEHYHKDFLPKSIDSVGILQNQSRFRQNESDPSVGKRQDAEYVDKVQTVQGTPTKGKKSRRGLFALLTDVGGTKQSGSAVRDSDISALRVSGNLWKATNAKPGEAGGFGSSPRKVSGNVGLGSKPVDGEMRDYQHLGSRMSGNLGNHEVGRESNCLTVEIPDKMVGLAWLGTEPRLLSSGTYSLPPVGFMLEQIVSERSSYVKHGMLHRVRIREGHLGVAWVDGKAVLLEAGVSVHVCPSNKFSYITTDDKMVLEKEFVLGPFRVVTVHDSEVGIKFCNRQPQILYSGRHCLSISKVEVFAGFESLLRRQSNVREVSAMSNDNMKVNADVWVEWQIKAEDAAAARLANITDVEGALCGKVRRAFNLVIWEVNAHDLNLQLTRNTENTNTDPHPRLKTLSSNIQRECQDLFEEGWTMTIWDLQLRQLVILPEVKDAQG